MRNLKEMASELRREYLREWRRKNPNNVKRNNQKYWEKKATEQVAERTKKETKN